MDIFGTPCWKSMNWMDDLDDKDIVCDCGWGEPAGLGLDEADSEESDWTGIIFFLKLFCSLFLFSFTAVSIA